MRTLATDPNRRARAAAAAWLDSWEHMPAVARSLGVAGVVLAFALLIGFYIVVAGAVHRAELGRQHARLEIERAAACSAFTQAEARELCAVTIANGDVPSTVSRAVYEPPAWNVARRQVSTRLY